MRASDQQTIQQTIQWIQSFIIKLNICPFAKREMDRNSARIQVSEATDIDAALKDLMTEIELLDTHSAIETTLLLFPSLFDDFLDYLDFVDIANANLVTDGYEGVYQLATFHPQYCFANTPANDVTNYTNRSPYPMLHILREERLEQAIAYYGDTTKIPEENLSRLRQLGLQKVKTLLQDSSAQDKTE